VSVADVNRALAFYTNKVRFTLDVDYWPAPGFRVVQLTPPGSATSIQIGLGITTASQGSAQGLYLVAADLETTHRELTERRVTVGAIRHKAPVEDWRGEFEPGWTQTAAKTPASPTSLTPTATPGCCRSAATTHPDTRSTKRTPITQTEIRHHHREDTAMGLSWQQGPLGRQGRRQVPDSRPDTEPLLFAEPLRRRVRVQYAGEWIADSEDVLLLHEPVRE